MCLNEKVINFIFRTKRISNILLSLLSAALLTLTFSYPGFSFLGWIALVPLFIVIISSRLVDTFFALIICSISFNVIYLFWLKEYKHPATLSGGVFLELLYFVSSGVIVWILYRGLLKNRVKWLRVFAGGFLITTGWVGIDYIKTVGFLAFPWGILGYSQYSNPILIQTASIFGVWGLDFLMIYCNSVLCFFLFGACRGEGVREYIPGVALWGLLFFISIVFGFFTLNESKKTKFNTTRVALIQANFNPWSPQLDQNLLKEIELSCEALKYNPYMIVWSESGVPFPFEFYLERGQKYARMIEDFISSTGMPFLFGSLEFQGDYNDRTFNGNFYNVGIFYNKGKPEGKYRKIHLVPFGEWFPYERLFPFVVRILEKAGAGSFTPGNEYTVFDTGDYKFNVLICFEDVFGNLARMFVLEGSELLINITNDAWTGSVKAEMQHFSISVFRTVENRRSLVRAANGGITACIDPYGRVLNMLSPFTADFLICDVPIVDSGGLTFYTRSGDILPQVLLYLSLVGLLYIALKKIIDRMKNKNTILSK